MAKSKVLTALEYLPSPEGHDPSAICVVFGNDPFLKREVVLSLQNKVFGDAADSDIGLKTFDGSKEDSKNLLKDVLDALSMISLFGGSSRLAHILSADDFVKTHRPRLEDYSDKPIKDAVLLLEVKTWPSNTRLAKKLAASKALVIDCSSPDSSGNMKATDCRQVREWLIPWAKAQHGLTITKPVADAMMELVSLSPGLLNQELAKLVGLASKGDKIDVALIQQHVGNWRTRTAWEMIDAAASGNTSEAINQLDRLITAGEAPHALLPMLSSTLRRFATAARLIVQGEKSGRKVSLYNALKDAGVPPFKIKDAEAQLRQIGRDRAINISQWILDADLAIKGTHSSGNGPQLVIELLIAKLNANK